MFGIDAITSYLLSLAVLALVVALLAAVAIRQKGPGMVLVGVVLVLLGLVLGGIGSYAVMKLAHYGLAPVLKMPEAGAPPPGGPMGMGGPPGMGMPGMGMPGMGMGGGPQAPRPKQELITLVRKLDLLTGDIAISLSPQQKLALAECLKDIDAADKMSDEEAKAACDKIQDVLDKDQQARLEAIALPRPARGAGGPPGLGAPGAKGEAKGPAAKPDEAANPFKRETEAKALKSLRDRLAAPKS